MHYMYANMEVGCGSDKGPTCTAFYDKPLSYLPVWRGVDHHSDDRLTLLVPLVDRIYHLYLRWWKIFVWIV